MTHFGRFVGSLLVGIVSAILVFLAVAVLRWAMNAAGFPVTPSEALTVLGVSALAIGVCEIIASARKRAIGVKLVRERKRTISVKLVRERPPRPDHH